MCARHDLAAREPHRRTALRLPAAGPPRAQRVETQHPGVERLRYPITFRNLRAGERREARGKAREA